MTPLTDGTGIEMLAGKFVLLATGGVIGALILVRFTIDVIDANSDPEKGEERRKKAVVALMVVLAFLLFFRSIFSTIFGGDGMFAWLK